MGLERLGLVVQGKEWSMETNELWHIMTTVQSIVNEDRDKPYTYGDDPRLDLALRVIADHVRGVATVIADNVVPSNEGAGYVVRRLIRRAYRFGRVLGAEGPFLYRVLPSVGEAIGQTYPEVLARQDYAMKAVHGEEERFDATLEQGLAMFEEIAEDLGKTGGTVIDGRRAFRLNDTYGFPVELTRELAQERGLSVDEEGYAQALAQQRERARGKARGLELSGDVTLAAAAGCTAFTGYDTDQATAKVTLIVKDGAQVDGAATGEEVGLVLDTTPFYAESGGQVGDTGLIESGVLRFEVQSTVALGTGALHVGKVISGAVSLGDEVNALVDVQRRWDIRRNHTATHLLQAALRKVLGDHVAQSGSAVQPDRLRFDFSHHEALTRDELAQVEEIVNFWVMADVPICATEMPLDEARNLGAMALFGEKYEDTVRVVRAEGVSLELCGGTHSESTGQIGFFRILHEGSVAAGIRRIEAVTGRGAVEHVRQTDQVLHHVAESLNCKPAEVVTRIEALHKRISELQADLKAARELSAATSVDDLVASAAEVGHCRLVTANIPGADRDALAALADKVVGALDGGVAMLGSVEDGKVVLVCKVGDAAVASGGHAGNLVKAVAGACGGGGGGRPNFAQAGGTQPDKLDSALAAAADVLRAQIG